MEFSRDEKRHAERFGCLLPADGKKYQPGPARPSSICDYEQSLKRIMEETNAYEEYGRKYQDLCDPVCARCFGTLAPISSMP